MKQEILKHDTLQGQRVIEYFHVLLSEINRKNFSMEMKQIYILNKLSLYKYIKQTFTIKPKDLKIKSDIFEKELFWGGGGRRIILKRFGEGR